MTSTGELARGRTAFVQEAWSDACAQLAAADRHASLGPEDLDRLATAAYLVGEDAVSADARARAHHGFLERGEANRAVRSAFWLALAIIDKPGQQAQAGGWLARARRLLDETTQEECVEHALLLCANGFQQGSAGDLASAHRTFAEAARIGSRLKDPDVTALARHGEGRTLLRLKKTAEGLAMLDEVMVAVTCGEVGPMVAGVVYCSVISACHDLFDFRRAQEWTTALAGWCAAHPDMVPFQGACLIRRSELMQLHGAWQSAMDEAQRACDRLANPPGQPESGSAYYQQAELFRLRGEFEKANEGYRRASQAGLQPDPGLALLRLAEGHIDAAQLAIRRALEERRGIRTRAQVLRAGVEIMLAGHDLPNARSAVEELTRIAAEHDAPFLRAASAHASGALALAAGDASNAAGLLREAWAIWQELDAPYEVAQVRALIGLTYRQLGDEDGAQMEFDAAQETFERLGAAPAAAHLAAVLTIAPPQPSSGLTGREVEVLRLVASGRTNRVIAAELDISEKTVARHISNIFTKLGLSSRSAATAYAYEHNLL